MHPDFVRVVIRQTADRFSDEVVEAMVFQANVPEGEPFDPSETTGLLREYLFRNGGVAFSFEERRTWIDAGASGAGVEFVVELLGSGAVGVAMSEIYRYARARFQSDGEWERKRYEETSDSDLRDKMLTDLEHHMGLDRGSAEVERFDRCDERAVLIVRASGSGRRYAIRRFSEGGVQLRAESSSDDASQ